MQVVALFLNFKTFLNVLILIRVLLFWYAGDAHFYLFLLALYKSFMEKKKKEKKERYSVYGLGRILRYSIMKTRCNGWLFMSIFFFWYTHAAEWVDIKHES